VNLRPRRPQETHINLTSLIDVVLLLIIFFMVSTSFVEEAELNISLPTASETPSVQASDALEVLVSAEGRFHVDGRELVNTRAETLERALQQLAGEDRTRPLTIRADARAAHQDVVTVMDVAGRMGFAHINIVTLNRDRE
jgi:biopolymer transport protein ExbD